jgi:hypothetical protein
VDPETIAKVREDLSSMSATTLYDLFIKSFPVYKSRLEEPWPYGTVIQSVVHGGKAMVIGPDQEYGQVWVMMLDNQRMVAVSAHNWETHLMAPLTGWTGWASYARGDEAKRVADRIAEQGQHESRLVEIREWWARGWTSRWVVQVRVQWDER